MTQDYERHNRTSADQSKVRETLYRLFEQRPLSDQDLLTNLGMYMRSSALAKLLFLNEMYEKIVEVPGQIFVFGVWWGQDVVAFENLRAVHEPYNYTRRIVGFDTFEGYPDPAAQDVVSETIKTGGYAVTENYEDYLKALLSYHETENVMGHISKHKLVKGDLMETLDRHLENHPETVVSLAYFDLALYEPTKKCLEAIRPYLVKGSIIVMDELNSPDYPGETLALRESFGLDRYRTYRSRILPDRSYLLVD